MPKKQNKKECDTKQKILSTAFDLFAQRGMRDISMREIAQACKVSKPVIYYYFKDKDALCFETVKDFGRRQEERLLSTAAANPDFAGFLEKLFASFLGKAANKNMLSFLMHLHSYASSNPRIERRLKAQRARSAGLMLDILRAQEQSGKIAPGACYGAQHLISASIMHMVLSSHHSHIKFRPTHAADIAKAILKAVDYKGDIK